MATHSASLNYPVLQNWVSLRGIIMSVKRLFVIDVMAMVFRNYHAFYQSQLTNSNKVPTWAIYGSTKFLLKLLREERPDYLIFATDMDKKTFRHELYQEYKANRSAMPEDLAVQMPYLYRLLAMLSPVILKQAGFEADDLIGSLVMKYQNQSDLECHIVSRDKDYLQLLGNQIKLYSPKKGNEVEIVTGADVVAKFGVPPEQVIEVLALMGDQADNIPGVAHIGQKGAIKLISEYGNLEGIYDNIDRITNKRQKNALESGRQQAFLSRDLVTIKTDIDIPLCLEDFRCGHESILTNRDFLLFLQELGFSSIIDQLGTNEEVGAIFNAKACEPSDASRGSLDTTLSHSYTLVSDSKGFDDLIALLSNCDRFCFDTETTGLDCIRDSPIGISFSVKDGEAYYLPIVKELLIDMDIAKIKESLAPIFGNPGKLKIGHNIKFDLMMLENIGLTVKPPLADTMVMAHLFESNLGEYNLDALCFRYLNHTKIPITTLIGKDKKKSMLDVNIGDLSYYAGEDADYTLRLFNYLSPLIDQNELTEVFTAVEMPLIPILARMERFGVYIDRETLKTLSLLLDKINQDLATRIYEIAGESFNLNSPKQLQVILYEKLQLQNGPGVKKLPKTKSGFSTNVNALEILKENPIAQHLLEYRTCTKLKNTYSDSLPKLINPATNRLHTSFHQIGTATGRLSSTNPNLQNIPIRTDLGKKIRGAFCAKDKDTTIISADYSQIELRILAHLAMENALIQAFRRGEDIHLNTAAKIFGLSSSEVTPLQRNQAKAINFGIIYGMGPQRLAKDTGISFGEAKEFIVRYFNTYPEIKVYIEKSIEFAQKHGFTKTILGRKRPLPEINSTNKMTVVSAQNIAVNTPIQGSAADLIKTAMIKVQDRLDKENSPARMLLQIHDELVFECPLSHVHESSVLIKETMESAMDLEVPLIVEISHGATWLDAH